MKKFLAMLLMLTMLCSCALADTALTDCAIANGNVQATRFVDVTAPYTGTLDSFDLEMGDSVKIGDKLFTLQTTTVYATEDGTVQAVFGQSGDDASALCARYGAVVAMEAFQDQRVMASTIGAYNEEENKNIHVGETLYFQSTLEGKEEGVGRVISVTGSSYVVDILEGEFDLNESLIMYRSDSYAKKHNVGKGSVVRRDPVLYQGQGRIAEMLVSEGDAVQAGDPLFTLMYLDAASDATPVVSAPADGVVANVAVSAGQQVWKGQVLARIYLTEEIEVVTDVDEIDLNGLAVGNTLRITLDADEDTIINGTVTEISALGVTKQNAAYYTVHISIPAGSAMLGASASVYIPQN